MKTAEPLEFWEASLGQRKAFANAAACGLAVTELMPPDEKAVQEIRALYAYVFCIESIYAAHTAYMAAGAGL